MGFLRQPPERKTKEVWLFVSERVVSKTVLWSPCPALAPAPSLSPRLDKKKGQAEIRCIKFDSYTAEVRLSEMEEKRDLRWNILSKMGS